MPATTGEGDLSGNTNSIVVRVLSPNEVIGILSGGFSWVDVCDVAGMSSAEIMEAVLESMQPKAPSRIPSRDDVLEPVRAILIFPVFLGINGQLSSLNEWLTPEESHPKSTMVNVKFDSRESGEIQIVKYGY